MDFEGIATRLPSAENLEVLFPFDFSWEIRDEILVLTFMDPDRVLLALNRLHEMRHIPANAVAVDTNESHLHKLKTQLIETLGWLDDGFPSKAVLPCSPDDFEEISMLLDDLYPKSNYRAQLTIDPATVVILLDTEL